MWRTQAGSNTKILAIIAVIAVVAVAAVAFVMMSNGNGGGDNPQPDIVIDGDKAVCEKGVLTTKDINDIKEKAKSNDKLTLELKNGSGTVVLDNAAILSLNSAAALHVDQIPVSDLSEEVLNAVGTRPVYDLSLGNNKSFGSGTATVTLPYTPIAGEDTSKIVVNYVDASGVLTSVPSSYSDGFVTFTTTHFSYYVIYSEQTCTIRFIVDGNPVQTTTPVLGAIIKAPADPAAPAGKFFCGWSGFTVGDSAVADRDYNAYFGVTSARNLASAFTYDGVFGTYTLGKDVSDERAFITSTNEYTANPTNDIRWYAGYDAMGFYNGAVAAMGALTGIQEVTPVKLAVDGVNDLTVYKVDVEGVTTFTVVYFAAYYDGVTIYAVDVSSTPDRYSGVMTTIGALATDAEISELIGDALESVHKEKVPYAVGYAADKANEFVANYVDGVYGAFTVGTAVADVASANGAGTVTWVVSASAYDMYATAVSALEASEATKVRTAGYSSASVYTSGDTLYFTAATDSFFVSNFVISGNSVSGGSTHSGATDADMLSFVNTALRVIGVSVRDPSGTASMLNAAEWFVKNYDDKNVDAGGNVLTAWTVLPTSSDLKADIHCKYKPRSTEYNADIVLSIESDIDAAYAAAVAVVEAHDGASGAMGTTYSLLDYSIDGIIYEGAVCRSSSSTGFLFAMKVGNILVDGSCPWPTMDAQGDHFYIKATGEEAQNREIAYFLNTLKSAVTEHSGAKIIDFAAGAESAVKALNALEAEGGKTPKNTWSVVSSDASSAAVKFDYTSSTGAKTGTITATSSDDAEGDYQALARKVAALEGTSFLKTTVYSAYTYGPSDITYTAVWYDRPTEGGTMTGLRFCLVIGDVLVDASLLEDCTPGYPYIYVDQPNNDNAAAQKEFINSVMSIFQECFS